MELIFLGLEVNSRVVFYYRDLIGFKVLCVRVELYVVKISFGVVILGDYVLERRFLCFI